MSLESRIDALERATATADGYIVADLTKCTTAEQENAVLADVRQEAERTGQPVLVLRYVKDKTV